MEGSLCEKMNSGSVTMFIKEKNYGELQYQFSSANGVTIAQLINKCQKSFFNQFGDIYYNDYTFICYVPNVEIKRTMNGELVVEIIPAQSSYSNFTIIESDNVKITFSMLSELQPILEWLEYWISPSIEVRTYRDFAKDVLNFLSDTRNDPVYKELLEVALTRLTNGNDEIISREMEAFKKLRQSSRASDVKDFNYTVNISIPTMHYQVSLQVPSCYTWTDLLWYCYDIMMREGVSKTILCYIPKRDGNSFSYFGNEKIKSDSSVINLTFVQEYKDGTDLRYHLNILLTYACTDNHKSITRDCIARFCE